jgi:hypothetical protein
VRRKLERANFCMLDVRHSSVDLEANDSIGCV